MGDSNREIRKFFTKPVKGTSVEFNQTVVLAQDNTVINRHNLQLYQKIHPDLQQALDRLIPHLVMLNEEPKAYELTLTQHYFQAGKLHANRDTTDYIFRMFTVTGAVIRENGVQLLAVKKFKNGQSQPRNSIFIHYEQQSAYVNVDALKQDVDDLVGEINRYLNGKFILESQLNLAFEAGANSEENEEVDISQKDSQEAKPFSEETTPITKLNSRKKKPVSEMA